MSTYKPSGKAGPLRRRPPMRRRPPSIHPLDTTDLRTIMMRTVVIMTMMMTMIDEDTWTQRNGISRLRSGVSMTTTNDEVDVPHIIASDMIARKAFSLGTVLDHPHTDTSLLQPPTRPMITMRLATPHMGHWDLVAQTAMRLRRPSRICIHLSPMF